MIQPFDDTYFMKKALQEAELAFNKKEVPVGAVIVMNDKIIARAHNLTETLNDVTAHAEMQAFTAAADFLGGKYLRDCILYVTLEPCQMCAGASYWTQIGKIVYGASEPQRGFVNLQTTLHPKTKVVSGILEDECSHLMKRFFIEQRNLNYDSLFTSAIFWLLECVSNRQTHQLNFFNNTCNYSPNYKIILFSDFNYWVIRIFWLQPHLVILYF